MVDKLVEESLMASNYMRNLLNNITIVVVETKKLTELVITMNDRLNKQEEIILRLVNQNQSKTKSDHLEYSKQKKEPPKLN
ncbi:MAG: hypothetical protein FJZ60_00205 [Chlamydiae bacterium]|nr:hypothetical protein [Chlamydiota bacterium]